jgi:two-component system CheB/CheR fusion protein
MGKASFRRRQIVILSHYLANRSEFLGRMSADPGRQPKTRRSRPNGNPPAAPEAHFEPEGMLVVGIGASAGGLDAVSKLVDALQAGSGMAFILVQHLDPTHESMMADLLAAHTSMTVQQATDGMPVERDHLYIIPPGTYLAVCNGALQLSEPQARHGARMPFDFLLHSLADEYGARVICVILSGTGDDGSAGLKAVKAQGGLVIAQNPEEAGYDGMPRSAIATGAVDFILPVAEIPDALIKYGSRKAGASPKSGLGMQNKIKDRLPEIIELLCKKTRHDFRLYKHGTLTRRIERRMAMVGIEARNMDRYIKTLQSDGPELDLLAKDLLINVTSFFRDPKVFDTLARTVVPELVRSGGPDHPLRIWIAGCSTGEETYSLAMLFHEEIAAANLNIKLQVFASDVDPDAVATAREGLYPKAIEAEVSPARLARFFSKEAHSYRILPELRSTVVFTIQDVLADPPFSRLDLVSCRNLLIYLGPEAQANAISAFHFALREGGILLLGSVETVGNTDGRFQEISKPARLFRHMGRGRSGDLDFLVSNGGGMRVPVYPGPNQPPSRQSTLAELCRRLAVETYAPAMVLINSKQECLYSLGATNRYLEVAPGHPTHNLLEMAPRGMRIKLRSGIQQADQKNELVVVTGGRVSHKGYSVSFNIEIRPIQSDGEKLFLVAFIDKLEQEQEQRHDQAITPQDVPRVAALEQELEATRSELQSAIRNLEISSEDQKAINEEALSVNEEYQSTNEELLTSKEELQSLNEELTALNSQLQETLERQRTTSNDLQNVLYSTDVATLFLDTDLNIRFFTPSTKSLFRIIPSDVGRPLSDLNSLAPDNALTADARTVLRNLTPIEQEIETPDGIWFVRRILPYFTNDKGVEGVVITFTDITERKHVAKALEESKQQAELANVAKSRFLAAASHDLRQPFQALSLTRSVLARKIKEGKLEEALELVARLDRSTDAMSDMLNTLLDINQIEAGTIHAEKSNFPVNGLLDRLRDEFSYQAQALGLELRVVSCGLTIHSDPRLLEQMTRNLLANALKYTKRGRVLLGCRRHGDTLSIEIWDTGIGIPEKDLHAIFEEYHQLDNAVRERSRGLGLGLSIVQRLGQLLGHRVHVRSRSGKGSVFAIDVAIPLNGVVDQIKYGQDGVDDVILDGVPNSGLILIVEDDHEVRELLTLSLEEEGYRPISASDGVEALKLVKREAIRPDLILSDYNLPSGLNGLQFIAKLRETLHHEIPALILTGDISTAALRDIAQQNCIQLNKPMKPNELMSIIHRLLAKPHVPPHTPISHTAKPESSLEPSVIFIVDDDSQVRDAMRAVLEDDGRIVKAYASSEEFLKSYYPGEGACLLVDAYLPGMNGLDLLRHLRGAGDWLPAIMITGNSDVPMAVQAMKVGASDFIEKPVSSEELVASVQRAVEQSRDSSKLRAQRETALNHIKGLTARQREIMELVLAGQPSKNIAADLGISQRTVETHRATIMIKTGAKSLPALVRLALAATWNGVDDPRD